MAGITVSGVEPARVAMDAPQWGQQSGEKGQRQRNSHRAKLPSLLAAALPQADPEQCEMVYQLDGLGQIVGILVRHTGTEAIIATFDLDDLTRLVAETGQSGVLFESRG